MQTIKTRAFLHPQMAEGVYHTVDASAQPYLLPMGVLGGIIHP